MRLTWERDGYEPDAAPILVRIGDPPLVLVNPPRVVRFQWNGPPFKPEPAENTVAK